MKAGRILNTKENCKEEEIKTVETACARKVTDKELISLSTRITK